MKKVAVVGAVVAVGAAAAMAIVAGTASADVPGDCTGSVNLLGEPGIDPLVVAGCESVSPLGVGETNDDLRRLTDLPGWTAQDSVPARPGPGLTSTAEPGGSQGGVSRERYLPNPDGNDSADSNRADDDRAGDNRDSAGDNRDSAGDNRDENADQSAAGSTDDTVGNRAGSSDSDPDSDDSTESSAPRDQN
jgi:hypothetical protein